MAASTTRRTFVLGAAAAPLLARRAIAQARFPSRPVRIVIGFPPGGGIDILARLMAPKMSERLGQPVIVENRPGANGLIATQGVAQSEPDGHTILFGTTGNLAVNPVLYAGRPGMDMERDFAPLSQVASLAFVLVVNPVGAGEVAQGADRPRQGAAGRDAVRVERQRRPAASVRRAAEPAGRRSAPGTCPIAAARRPSPT